MIINEVKRLVTELYPELLETVVVFDDGKEQGKEVHPPCWHLCTYLNSKEGKLGVEIVITFSDLTKLSKKKVEILVRELKRAFSGKLEEITGRRQVSDTTQKT